MSLTPFKSLLSFPRATLTASWLLAALITGCSVAPSPAAPLAVAGDNPEQIEDVQAPTLPIDPANDPLPRLGGSVPLEDASTLAPRTLSIAAAASSKVQMKLLLVSPTASDPGLASLEALCDQLGVPCESFIASSTPLTQEKLVAANGDGLYQGIFLTDNQLAYDAGGSWVSAFDADEWNLLWQYARDYAVRQVSLYTYPGTFPESQGISYAGVAPSTGSAYYTTTLTPAGQQVFSTLKADAPVPIRYAYTYQAALDNTVSATPLIQDTSGNVLGVTSTTADGRERLALTMAHSPYLLHSQLLGYDLVRWVTKGIFLGQRQFYFGIDQDDWFAPTDKWDASVGGINGTYRMDAKDVAGVVAQQRKLRSDYPFARTFAWTMAFNGIYANTRAPRDCNVNTTSVDPLTSLTRCYKNEFYWLNHTWNHEYMDAPTSYSTAFSEIYNNMPLALRLGLMTSKYSYNGLITGDVSGLGWYAPGGPDTGAKVDYGLNASNREFLRAAGDLGVRYMASNMSVKSHEPVGCWGCGMTHPLDSRIFLIPRWPTNLFATPTTPTDMMDAYNRVYGPQGTSPYFDHNLSYDEYLDFEADIALYHLITGSPYQHYQHVGNLREYAPGRSLAYDWADRVLARYSRFYNKPIKTLDWDDLGKEVSERTSYRKAGVSGVIDMTAKTLSVTSSNGGSLFITSGPAATITKTTLGRGQTHLYTLP